MSSPFTSVPLTPNAVAAVISTPAHHAEGLLTKRELATRLRKSTRTVDHWCQRRIIPYIKMPGGKRGSVLFSWPAVLESLERFTFSTSK